MVIFIWLLCTSVSQSTFMYIRSCLICSSLDQSDHGLFTKCIQCPEQCLASSKHSIICCEIGQNYFCREAAGDSYEAGRCIPSPGEKSRSGYTSLCLMVARMSSQEIRRSPLWEDAKYIRYILSNVSLPIPSAHGVRENEMRWEVLKLHEIFKISMRILGDSILDYCKLDGPIIFFQGKKHGTVLNQTFYVSALFYQFYIKWSV